MSAPNKGSERVELRFRIRSLHPRIDSETMLRRAIDLTPELTRELAGSLADVSIEADRQHSAPLSPETAILIYLLLPKIAPAAAFAGKAVAAGALAAIGKDIYDFLKKKLTNTTVELESIDQKES